MRNVCLLLFALLSLGTETVKAQYTVLLNFNDTNGDGPHGSLIAVGNKLFGMTAYGGRQGGNGCIFSIDTNGGGYKDLFDFNSGDGSDPFGSLAFSGGILYGMTCYGGARNYGCIFSIDTNGNGFKDLFNFNDSISGTNPWGSLIILGNKLYGMVYNDGLIHRPIGAAFSINKDGSEYRNFIIDAGAAKGSFILSGSQLFGTSSAAGIGYGNVFSFDTNGSNFKSLWAFIGMPNDTQGINPYGSLILSGNTLYGMTSAGGYSGTGALFSIDTNGNNFENLFDFGGTNAGNPHGSLIFSQGVLYGMTSNTIFSINTDGSGYTDLYQFNGKDGSNPYGDLTLAGNALYGMTSTGGAYGDGVIFRIKPVDLGINDLIANKVSISVYPNPNNGQFTMLLSNINEKCNMEIYNVLGEKVYTSTLPPPNGGGVSYAYQMHLSSQPNGVYLYRIISENGNLLGEGKVIIEK